MFKLIKYLKPYTFSIVIIFVLLFIQAMSDLALPGYMSNIVNVGIQQHGIENSVPEVIRAGEFNKLTLFIEDNEKATLLDNYTLLDRKSLSAADYNRYVESYPVLESEPVYKLNPSNKDAIAQIDPIFQKSLLVVYTIEQGGLNALAESPITLPPGVDPFVFLAQLPSAQLNAIRGQVAVMTGSIPEMMIKQSSIAYLSGEYAVIGRDTGAIQIAYMIHIGLMMLLITLLAAACSVAVGFISAKVAAALGRDLRRKGFERVESFSSTEIDRFSTASLITRSTNDITQIQMLMVVLFRVVFYAPILAVGGVLKVLGSDSSMIMIIVAAVIALLMMMAVMFTIAIPKFKVVQKLVDKINLITREILTGLMVIRAFNTQKHEEKKFDIANLELTGVNLFILKVMVFMMPMMMLIMNGVSLLIVWVGAYQVDAGSMQVGDMMAFMQYAMQIIFSFLMMTVIFIMLPRASVSMQRVAEVLETEPVIKDPVNPVKLDGNQSRGLIEFKEVAFRYPGAEDDVLKNISFTAKPGQTTAVIGSTGSGKTTLVNLIPRFYDVTSGEIKVDGVDIRQVTQHDLRDRIGYISQKALLFSGTIESNIKYANDNISAAEIMKFAETAQAVEFINSSDKGLETPVAQGGVNFSGGQKQRLSIARAIAKRPEIFIFDDAFSALDFKTDAVLRRALKTQTGHSTVLIVTQRISTVMGADQIVVLDNGEIAGIGTHRNLMENCRVYQEIALSQLSREELS